MSRRASLFAALVVGASVLVGGIARVGSADWGLPYLLHVDEKGFVLWEVAAVEWRALQQDDWRPRTTTYGPLLYTSAVLLKWACFGGRAHAAEVAARYPDAWSYTMGAFGAESSDAPFSWAQYVHALRLAGALAASLAVLLLALAAWRLEGPAAGAVTAACSAACVGLLQASHYFTTDSLVIVEIAGLLHAAARLVTGGGLGSAVYAGVALGAILGTKMSGGLLGAVLPAALAYGPVWQAQSVRRAAPRLLTSRALRWLAVPLSPRLLVAVAIAVLVYFLLCPWPFTVPELYFDVPGNRSGAEVLRSQYRDTDYPFEDWRFTYNDTPRWLYVAAPVLSYALGGPLLGACVLGLLRGLSRRRALDAIAIAAVVPTFLLVGSWGVKTIRYALPCVPGLLLAGGALLSRWLTAPVVVHARRQAVPLVLATLAALVLAHAFAWGTAFALVFTRPDPRVAASRWLAARVRPGDAIVTEPESPYTAPLGEDADRIGLDPRSPFPSTLRLRRLWDRPLAPHEVAPHVESRLRDARFLVIGDFYRRRAEHPRARSRAASQAWLYRTLFRGETAYRLTATFDATPRLGPLRFDERGAETLSVDFDHMPVWVFERRGPWVSPLRP